MRLINVKTFDFEEFFGDDIPSYAILSHTWVRDEASYQEWKSIQARSDSLKTGFVKIRSACARALKDGFLYIWVDTVCIDKTSSAELSEAINSMFAWYRGAAICYAYLVDVTDAESLNESRWFTRGWTLQELLAPRRVRFYNRDWRLIGRKSDLLQRIASITRIRQPFVAGAPLQRASVAERMSWLSRRRTTRVEDMAYCMLGIFDLNIPLLYGEGSKAFVRLQEEIIRVSNDHTIFCWSWIPPHVPKAWRSVIAPSPAVFEWSSEYQPDSWIGTPSYTITNAGLSIALPLVQTATETLASLPVIREADAQDDQDMYKTVAIPLVYDHSHELFIRSPFPPYPIKVRSEMFAHKRSIMVDARNLRNGFFKNEPKKPDNPALRHGVLLVLPSPMALDSQLPVRTMNGEWDSSTGTFWVQQVGRDDFAAGILSIPINFAASNVDSMRQARLTVLFAIHKKASGVVRATVQQVEMPLRPPETMRDWHPWVSHALETTVQESVAMAEVHDQFWKTTMYSAEAGMTVAISSGEDCFRVWDDSLASVCHVYVGHDMNQLTTRRNLHRTNPDMK